MQAETCEQVAHVLCIVSRVELFNVAVRDGDRLWDDRLVKDVFEPGEVPVLRARLPAAGAVEDVRGRVRHALSVLHVDGCTGTGVTRVILPVADLYNREVRANCIGAIIAHEQV
jgi:hypothetical protein